MSDADIYVVTRNENTNNIEIKYNIIEKPNFSLLKDEKIGYGQYFINGESIGYFKIVSDRDYYKKKDKSSFLNMFYDFLSLIIK